jgi:hypothetical protein
MMNGSHSDQTSTHGTGDPTSPRNQPARPRWVPFFPNSLVVLGAVLFVGGSTLVGPSLPRKCRWTPSSRCFAREGGRGPGDPQPPHASMFLVARRVRHNASPRRGSPLRRQWPSARHAGAGRGDELSARRARGAHRVCAVARPVGARPGGPRPASRWPRGPGPLMGKLFDSTTPLGSSEGAASPARPAFAAYVCSERGGAAEASRVCSQRDNECGLVWQGDCSDVEARCAEQPADGGLLGVEAEGHGQAPLTRRRWPGRADGPGADLSTREACSTSLLRRGPTPPGSPRWNPARSSRRWATGQRRRRARCGPGFSGPSRGTTR